MSDLNTGSEPNDTGANDESQLPRKLRDPAQPLSVKELFEAGVHFGHQTKRWNPKMRPYIYGARSGIHIVDLDQTAGIELAAEITAMTSLEMKTLAGVLALLTPEQRVAVQTNGIRAPFFLFRGAFLEEKWNAAPKQAGY